MSITHTVLKALINYIWWGALAALVCQCTLDMTITGTFVWNFISNDLLKMNNTELQERAAQITQAQMFSRGVFVTIGTGVFFGCFCVYFDVRQLYQEESRDRKREQLTLSHLRLSESISADRPVRISIDPEDTIMNQLLSFHADQQHIGHVMGDHCHQTVDQWAVQNLAANRQIEEQRLTRSAILDLKELVSDLLTEMRFKESRY